MRVPLVEGDQLVQPVDNLLLDGQREERVLASPAYLVVDDRLLVDHTVNTDMAGWDHSDPSFCMNSHCFKNIDYLVLAVS